MAGAWISTRDRMPPADEKVIGYAVDFRYQISIVIWDGEWWRRPGINSTLIPVTHWQPLPDPPA